MEQGSRQVREVNKNKQSEETEDPDMFRQIYKQVDTGGLSKLTDRQVDGQHRYTHKQTGEDTRETRCI